MERQEAKEKEEQEGLLSPPEEAEEEEEVKPGRARFKRIKIIWAIFWATF